MNESELYKELGILTKDKNKWEENIPYVSSLLNHGSVKIQAKSLWLLGEMGFEYPDSIQDTVPSIVAFCESGNALLRERAVNAIGRIGRSKYSLIEPPEIFRVLGKHRPEFVIPYIEQLQKMAESDSNRVVRIHSLGAIKATTTK